MIRNEFLSKISETSWCDATRLSRLALGAIIPASWCREILAVLPEAEEYLRETYPAQMAERDQAEQVRAVMSLLGSRRSEKKAASSRQNGEKGGRPPKKKQ